ncbi:tetratricopeptide repeat protein [Rhodococcus sp. IEGM 1408]|uniref:tetratricopeptide repeat protein n=1 Tax=Rhodococcus sp. IEGM 1408 TaxID=3082220 RepID=UPI00295482EF|nr:tetratricopeptide repeat protein [Rhodococcus sp. IEGM 1408]MDV8000539.1 tetratricopeptide repeat protein [Rhodococcus sp. IEGM 1408]
MTRPGNRPPSVPEKQLAASLSGAVDLSGLKKRAEVKRDAAATAGAPRPGAGVASPVEVTEASFEEEVLVRSTQVPVVVELMSRRAPTALTAQLSAMAAEAGGQWVHAVVDVDAAPGIAQAFQARAVPTVVAVAAGRPLADFEGEQPEDALRQWIAAVLNATEGKLSGPSAAEPEGEPEEVADTERDAAEDALAEGDLVAAEERFTALVESRPGDHTLREALRYVQAARRATEESDAGEGTVLAALRAADRGLVGGEYDSAFAVLVDAIRVSAGDDRATLRARLVELLEALPADDPRVLAARRNLANALY